jgi:FAD-linked sulfhydryl oxidase
MARRQHLTYLLMAIFAFLGISFLLAFRNQAEGVGSPSYKQPAIPVSDSILHGEASAPKLENATLK